MSGGTEPSVPPDIMRNDHWRRLAAGFREVGALLILVARSDAEGIHELATMLDGVVVVGDAASVLAVPRNSVLAFVDAPQAAPAAPVVPPPAAAPARPERPPKQNPVMLPAHAITETPPSAPRVMKPDRSALQKPILIAVGAVLAAAVGWWALSSRSSAPTSEPAAPVAPPASAPAAADTTVSAAPQTTPTRADSLSAMLVANPADSLNAAPYGVVLVATNDEAQALALPAGTVSMVRIRGERGRFFQMQAGAFTKAKQADSLLAALRSTGKLGADAGRVVATPYALVLERKVSRRAAQSVANGYGQRQIAAYALLQEDGTATIYVGAFELPEQALPLMGELKAKGVGSALFYRTGRSF
jgi:hypothetical protein